MALHALREEDAEEAMAAPGLTEGKPPKLWTPPEIPHKPQREIVANTPEAMLSMIDSWQ